jgi:hypothetical protein
MSGGKKGISLRASQAWVPCDPQFLALEVRKSSSHESKSSDTPEKRARAYFRLASANFSRNRQSLHPATEDSAKD